MFYNPLADSGMLTEQELSTVFINWKELIWCNMRLLKYVYYIIKNAAMYGSGYRDFQRRGGGGGYRINGTCLKMFQSEK